MEFDVLSRDLYCESRVNKCLFLRLVTLDVRGSSYAVSGFGQVFIVKSLKLLACESRRISGRPFSSPEEKSVFPGYKVTRGFFSRLRPKTSRPVADEVPRRTRAKTSGTQVIAKKVFS